LLDFFLFLKKKEKSTLIPDDLKMENGKPLFGCGAIKIKIAPDFDAPMDDFKEYM
jgi:hypothetical protein